MTSAGAWLRGVTEAESANCPIHHLGLKQVRCAHDYDTSIDPHIRSEDAIDDVRECASGGSRAEESTICSLYLDYAL